MSRDDFETGKTILNPYIEIGRFIESNLNQHAYVNVSTFEGCLAHLIPPFTDKGPTTFSEKESEEKYCIYGAVGRTIRGAGGTWAYLNIGEPPISRTLMGFLSGEILEQKLPRVYESLDKE